MDHLPDLMRQAQRFELHNTPTSAVSDAAPSPELPPAPSIREALVQPPLLHVLPPPAAPHSGERSLPTLAAGVKRSAMDAGLDADVVPDGKRAKVSHANGPETEGLQKAMPDAPGLAVSRKRTASDAGLDENALSAGKRTCQRGPGGQDTWEERDMMAAVAESHTQEQKTAQQPYAVVPFSVDHPEQKQPGKLSRVIWECAYKGDLPAIQAWLKTPGIDVNANGEVGEAARHSPFGNALQAAIEGDAVAVVRALLATPGIDLTVKYPNGYTLLQCASKATAPLIIETMLAAQGFKVNALVFSDRHQEFAGAVEAGNLAQVRSLLADNPWLDINFEMTRKRALKLLGEASISRWRKACEFPLIRLSV